MASLARSAVTENAVWKGEGTSSRLFLFKDVTLVLTGQGGLTNTILAATLGMTKILGVRNARNASSVVVGAAPSYDGTSVVLFPSGGGAANTLKSYVATGRNGAGAWTVTGITAGETLVSVANIGGASAYAAASQIALTEFTTVAADTITQTSATDYSGKKLQVLTMPTVTQGVPGTPTDVTDTVRLTVFGYEL